MVFHGRDVSDKYFAKGRDLSYFSVFSINVIDVSNHQTIFYNSVRHVWTLSAGTGKHGADGKLGIFFFFSNQTVNTYTDTGGFSL